MRYGSVCSGIEAATMAWHPLGWTPEFFSEFDKFPSAVLAHHYPDTPNHGDMTKYKDWPNDRPIDLLVGGTPCQSFSVAGLRKGLDDPRGNLMLTYLSIARRFNPSWIVWENVPGVLSSNEGRDFGTFLTGMGQLGYGFAYRVIDAQYCRVDGFGRAVPQRRRRVFVVGYLGDWRRAASVLFDAESMRGNSAPRRKAGQGVAGKTEIRTGSGKSVFGTLAANSGSKLWLGNQECLTGDYHILDQIPEVAGTMKSMKESGGWSNSADHAASGYMLPISFQGNASGANMHFDEGVCATLKSGHSNNPAVAFEQGTHTTGHQGDRAYSPDGAWGTLAAQGGNNGGGGGGILAQEWAVRRLTPNECHRLQGFPDNFCRIPWRGKDAENCPDGPQYKALGNSMAVNVMRWIGQRIQMVEDEFPC